MAYIGSTPTTQSFVSGTDYFNGTGSQTAFTLTRAVNSVNDIEVVVNSVVQRPNSGYTVSGTTLTFDAAPSSGTNNVYVRYLSTTTQTIAPSQNSVGWNQLDTNTQQDLGISFKNRIINGAMVIDQRNAGASVTIPASTTTYTVDRWGGFGSQASKFSVQQNAGSVTPPAGFRNYLGCTSLSAYTVGASETFVIVQSIEGLNCSDLGWGTANAQTVTLSFWVRSSLTGTFGGYISNSAQNRSYLFSYTISSANTWEQKSITIAGDTTGTWLTTNGIGIQVAFNLGTGASVSGTANTWLGSALYAPTGATSVIGTNGATWYITGVQLEVGTQATAFDNRAYGTELALCQRYYETYAMNNSSLVGNSTGTSGAITVLVFKVTKRATATITLPAAGQTSGTVSFLTAGGGYPSVTGTNAAVEITVDKLTIYGSGYSGLTASSASIFWSGGDSRIQISSEL